jgi:ABC-2 type transport system ATP-binding protein
MAEIISANHLCKSFGKVKAVQDLSLHVHPGEIYGLVGADGAGKTTTIRLLCGALSIDSGDVTMAGYDIRRQADQARAQIGYLSQRFSLYEDLTVLENIRFFAEVRGLKSGEWYPRCMEILQFVGLAEYKDRYAGKLSGGMKQKLGLATALVVKPKIFLFDEPTTGVDPVTRQDFWQLIIRLVNPQRVEDDPDSTGGKVAVLVSTPYMDEAARCNRIGFMHSGRLIAEGTPGELRSLLVDRILEVRGTPLHLLKEVMAAHPAVEDVRAFGDCLHLRLRTRCDEATLRNLMENPPAGNGTITSIRPIPPVLEDVFIALSGQTNVEKEGAK